MTQPGRPWRMKEMTPGRDRRSCCCRRPTLIVPVGTTEQHGPHLPLGCDTIIVERLSDDLSAAFTVLRAPTVEFGVHAISRPFPGGAALRHRTLHRVMNELIESWEEGAGVREFVILTAQASEAHLEALSTIRTDGGHGPGGGHLRPRFRPAARPARRARSRAASSTPRSCSTWRPSWSAWTSRSTSR